MSFPNYPSHTSQPDISQILQKQNEYINNLKTKLDERDKDVEALMQKVLSLQVESSKTTEPSSKNQQGTSYKKKTNIKHKSSSTKSKGKAPKSQNSSKNKSHSGSQKTRSAQSGKKKTQTRPNQLIMMNIPESFKPTKSAFFTHIRIIWGLIYQKSVPIAPDPSLLKEFYNRFDHVDEIHQVTNSTTAIYLIPEANIITLRGTKPEPTDTLYNEACRISAIKTLQQVAIGGAYQYMNINLHYLNNVGLLEVTYNHFVHYLQAKIYKRELKESGSYQKELEKGTISKNRQRFCKARYKFGVSENFPKRYLKILADINAHSDDEFAPEKKDEEIEKALENQGKKSQKHNCIEIEGISPTIFGRVPKGLPIDFYNHDWYNNCTAAQKTIYGDTMKISFFPDASQSICGIQHPGEKMNDKRFSEKYWEKATQKYNLSHEIYGDDSDESESDSEDIESSSSSGIGSLSNEEGDSDSDLDDNGIMETSQTLPAQIVGAYRRMEYGYNWENWQ
ncbi:hypothetical protein O181_026977 [Austropuccinia psidii MF-1]|uniref:Uncharacterized protein n=1 Tax=Austropuccinia psidii MF-1 TaxID=1389203 RepID=A0A9Q3CRN7_9BASI|nr:hypothetical protein [Austropuccinia psidii MF-1]